MALDNTCLNLRSLLLHSDRISVAKDSRHTDEDDKFPRLQIV